MQFQLWLVDKASWPSWDVEPSDDECPGIRYSRDTPVPYDTSCWAQVGEAVLVSLLDLYGHNCYSRLPTSKYKSVTGLLDACLAICTRKHRAGYPCDTALQDTTQCFEVGFDALHDRERPCGGNECCWRGVKTTGSVTTPSGPSATTQARRASSPRPPVRRSRGSSTNDVARPLGALQLGAVRQRSVDRGAAPRSVTMPTPPPGGPPVGSLRRGLPGRGGAAVKTPPLSASRGGGRGAPAHAL